MRLDKLRSKDEFFNRGDNNNNNSNNFPFIPPPPPPPPKPPNLSDFSFVNRPPYPPLLPPPPRSLSQLSFFNDEQTSFHSTSFFLAKERADVATNTTQTISSKNLISELKKVNEKPKPKKNYLVPDDNIFYFLPEIPTILDDQEYEKKGK